MRVDFPYPIGVALEWLLPIAKLMRKGRRREDAVDEVLQVFLNAGETAPLIDLLQGVCRPGPQLLRRARRETAQGQKPGQPGDGATSGGALVMRPPQVNYGWNPIETAPFDEEIALQVTDGRGGPYMLHWPCRRTASGWINSRKGTPLEVTPVRWKPYLDRPPRPPRPE
jgi:hypothetical protein